VVEAIGALQRPQAGADHQHGARLKALERENRELRRANEILRKASSYLAPSRRVKPSACRAGRGARPPVQAMIAFIDDHRQAHGVEPICKLLPIAPSTYHGHATRRSDPARQSSRAGRVTTLMPEISRMFEENFRVYGVRKV